MNRIGVWRFEKFGQGSRRSVGQQLSKVDKAVDNDIRWASQFDYTTITTVVNLGQLSHRWWSLSDAFVAETIDFSGGDFFANLSLIQFPR